MSVSRRDLMAGAAAVTTAAALPAGTAGAQARRSVLKVVPHANLQIVDPIFTTGYISRNHGYMIYDTLFALDDNLQVRPQMASGVELSADRLTYRIGLRDGLAWHDDTAVTAADCVASLTRWGRADGMGQRLFAQVDSVSADGDRTIVLKLKNPYGLTLDSLGKISSNVPFMMPKRYGETPHTQQLKPEDIIGSGPFTFASREWRPGAVAVYLKNAKYQPRAEPVSSAAGGKIAKVDRVEWITMPDSTTAMNALMNGEVDYYEQVPIDLVPILSGAPGVKVEVLDPVGNIGMLRFNHLVAPTNNALVRRAVMKAINQADVLKGVIGNPQYYKVCNSVYPCGTPSESTAGIDLIKFNQDEARQLLREANYRGEKIVILQPTDIPNSNGFALFAADAMRRVGINVELQAMDWSTLLQRRARRDPVDQGGWNMFPTWWIGGDVISPITQIALAGTGDRAWVGWPTDERIEALRAEYAASGDAAKQKELAGAIQTRAFELGLQAYVGLFYVPVGYRTNVRGMIRSPVQFFWNMEVG
jgi:peptide/nickel transport system substrate-binding protein